jgi:hypothetical protein
MKSILSSVLILLCSMQAAEALTLRSPTKSPIRNNVVSSIANAPDAKVRGIDVFGTSQITSEQVRQKLGKQITQFALAPYRQNPDMEAIEKLYKEIVTAINQMGRFASVDIAPVTYFRDGNPIYVTIDVVDRADATRRLSFRPKPTQTFTDPDGLFQQWAEYEKTAMELAQAGKIKTGYQPNSPLLNSSFGFDHPTLQHFVPIFEKGVARNRKQLIQILTEDKNETHRGYAVFLLSATQDAQSYVRLITPYRD